MAAPGGKFFIQEKLTQKAKHHESYEQLWETKWKKPVCVHTPHLRSIRPYTNINHDGQASMSIYPFMFSTLSDFTPIISTLTSRNFKEPYDWDAYALAHFPQAEHLTRVAQAAEAANEADKASEYFLRSSAVYRIARFPAPRSEQQRYAWEMGKEMCIRGLGLRPHPVREVFVPHRHGMFSEGDTIPVYYLCPENASKDASVPLLIIFTGLDGYRTELAVWMEGWRQNGVATVVLEIPGTGDCPAKADDPASPDRLYSSLFDWVAQQEGIDQTRVAVWAFSTGGYYAIRVAHTHHDNLAGVIALGGGCHHMFDRQWLDAVNHLEYPFDLANTLAYKWGYGDDVEEFKAEASEKFSLLNDGTLDRPDCARLLLVNVSSLRASSQYSCSV
jgi:dienelactone hydrolase